MTIHQYSKTTDPEVLAALERNHELWVDSHKRAVAFAAQYGAEDGAYYGGIFMGHRSVSAIAARKKPTDGQWTKGNGGRGWRPFKSNPLSKEMDALGYTEERVPGLPKIVHSVDRSDGNSYIGTPIPFIHDGAAYLGFSFQPTAMREHVQPQAEGQEWVEILASEYEAARVAYNEARKDRA